MKTIESLRRGLEILRLLNDDGISHVRDLHAATGLPKSTIVRMLETLEAAGYVKREADGASRVTARVLGLAKGFDADDSLMRVAGPALDAVREAQGWPVEMATFDRDAMVVLSPGRQAGAMSLNRPHGSRLPLLVTALGKAYLAFCPDEERARTLVLLRASPDPRDRLARDDAAIGHLFDRIRRAGFATNDREHLRSTVAVAVPVLVDGLPVACVAVLALASVMTIADAVEHFVPPLREAAAAIACGLLRGSSADTGAVLSRGGRGGRR